jgi:hypothetical protein
MIKSILGLALAATTAVTLAAPAQAHELRTDSTEQSVKALMNTAQGLGIRFQVNTQECRDTEGLMGYMEAPHMVTTLCVDNHRAYGAQAFNALADTVRHELVHVAQFCKATHSTNILFPGEVRKAVEFAQVHLGWHILGYPTHQWDSEAEARAIAHEVNDIQVGRILNRACRYSDTKRTMIGDIRLGRRPLVGLPRPESRR